MIEASGYNKGSPYFVEFRPIFHSPIKLTANELSKYMEKYPYLSSSKKLKKPVKVN